MDLRKELGVKGYCLRGYLDNPTVAARVRECGVDCIDLSRSQLDFKNTSLHEPAIETYRSAGIRIVGIGVVPFDSDEAGETQYFEFCKKAECGTISCTFAPETLDRSLVYVEQLCEQYDMRVAIHNHGGKDWLGNSRMLAHVLKKSSHRIGLCVDTAWCFHAGENPVQWLEKFSDRIYAIHYKDFLFGPKGDAYDVIVGKGCLDLKVFIQGLKAINFTGPAVIEYEGDIENPIPALQQCVHEMLNYL